MAVAQQSKMLALFNNEPSYKPPTGKEGEASDQLEVAANPTAPRLPDATSHPQAVPATGPMNGVSPTNDVSTPSPTSHAVSTFHVTPITDGPFNPSKYGKPTAGKNPTQPGRDLSTTPSTESSSTRATKRQSKKFLGDAKAHSLSTPNISHASTGPLQNRSRSPLVQASTPGSPDTSPFIRPQANLSTESGTQFLRIDPLQSKDPNNSGAIPPRSFSAKPAVDLTSQNLELPITPDISRALVLRSSPITEQLTQPTTLGRPLVRLLDRSDYQALIMSNSNQVNAYSVTSTSAHPGESPHDHLKRIQRVALIKQTINSRRRNKHDTAFPEILAFIRKPLDPRVALVVEHRVAHYWMIGNENLPATTSVGVEPNWPRGLHDSDTEPANSFRKQSKDLILTPNTERFNTPVISRKSNSRWVTNAEVRAPPQPPNSNAWGSGPSSGTAANSQDSVRVEGKCGGGVKLGEPNVNIRSLAGWDGNMQPPPVDWHDRPRFDNNTVEYQNHFNHWGDARVEELVNSSPSNTVSFRPIDQSQVLDVSNHADGLGFVSAMTTVTAANAEYYGYLHDSGVKELANASVPLTKYDFESACIVRMDDPSTAALVDETTEGLVQRWIGQNGWLKDKRVPSQKKAKLSAPTPHYQSLAAPETPEMRISLRPATVSDIPGMTRIYNWYVKNSSRTTEFAIIPESHMRGRFDDVRSSKLPIVVAVARNRVRGSNSNASSYKPKARHATAIGHPITNTNLDYQGMTEEETIVGWACASDLTAHDYVERITAECELYVAHNARQFGVGKALMDKLLEACDRGYIKQGSYDWRCAPAIQHEYNGGGGRDLHKLYFVVRKWSNPVQALTNGDHGKRGKKTVASEKVDDQDNEWDAWLKGWMEAWGFEVEGLLKKVGAKNGRFLDVVYMGRETMWQPQEGKIPDPLHGAC